MRLLDLTLTWLNRRRQSRNEARLLRENARLRQALADQKARASDEADTLRQELKVLSSDVAVAHKEVEFLTTALERYRVQYQADIAVEAMREATGGRSAKNTKG